MRNPVDAAAAFHRWTDYYREKEPSYVLVARAADGRPIAYLTGAADSLRAGDALADHPGFLLFQDLHATYPAHFHINCHPDHRSRGVGSRLITAFCDRLQNAEVPAVHLVTAADARNLTFYSRNGFEDISTRHVGGRQLLFLGKRLGRSEKRPACAGQVDREASRITLMRKYKKL